jgi:hypothetical protein
VPPLVAFAIVLADIAFHIGDLGSLAIIVLLLVGGAVASLVADRLDPPHPAEEASRRPPRCPAELTPPLHGALICPTRGSLL